LRTEDDTKGHVPHHSGNWRTAFENMHVFEPEYGKDYAARLAEFFRPAGNC
jgi:hypothetical protein